MNVPTTLVSSVAGALLWIVLAGLVPEPWRRRSQSLLVAMAAGIYVIGPLSLWEVPMAFGVIGLALIGLVRYWGLGAAWLAHCAIDVVHHCLGAPMVPGMPTSSLGCAAMDSVLATWFFLGAPPILQLNFRRRAGTGSPG